MVRITPQDAEKMMAAYQKVYAPQDDSQPESESNSKAPQVSDEIAAAAAKLSAEDEDAE
tara:strand:- start:269 stop:445 length:177 start_codon:yes stop_codon:yes gene_type:complete